MKILSALINYSIEYDASIIECFNQPHVMVMDVNSSQDYNRMVVSVLGQPTSLLKAIVQSVKTASTLIDVNTHQGEHPFIGATDVIPLVPLQNITTLQAIDYSIQLAKQISKLNIPVFLYEKSFHDRKLASIRKGGYSGLKNRLENKDISFDFGQQLHPTAGASVVGVRKPLIAYNVTLNSLDINLAKDMARNIRESSGGLAYVSAIGVYCESLQKVQVSTNLRDYKVTSLDDVYQAIQQHTDLIESSEIIGCVFEECVKNPSSLKLTRFNEDMIIESWLKRFVSQEES